MEPTNGRISSHWTRWLAVAGFGLLLAALAVCFVVVPGWFGGHLFGALVGVAAAVAVCGVAERVFSWLTD